MDKGGNQQIQGDGLREILDFFNFIFFCGATLFFLRSESLCGFANTGMQRGGLGRVLGIFLRIKNL